jgi:hypothetical protein
MKVIGRAGLAACVVTLAAFASAAAFAQMVHPGGMMGGGRQMMINLVSPADSPIRVRRGVLMIGAYASRMVGHGPTTSIPPGTAGGGVAGIRVVLRLYGVADADSLVTSAENLLVLDGELSAPSANRTPIHIERSFALSAGNASVQAFIDLPAFTDLAALTIDRIAVEDHAGDVFAMPGLVLVAPIPPATPGPTPGAGCVRDSDCDDGNPNTRDVCTPLGCRHMPNHMGPGGSMM